MENPMIQIRHKNNVTVVEFLAENILDEDDIDNITKSLFSLVEDDSPTRMLLNFTKVKFLSSSMLGTLVRLSKRIAEKEGTLKLCSIDPSLFVMFIITKQKN